MSTPARYPLFSSADLSRTRVTLRDLAEYVDVEAAILDLPDMQKESTELQPCAAGPMMRKADPEQETQRPKQRNFLLIRRPVHRPGRMHRKTVKRSELDNRAVQVIIIFSSFLALALLYIAVL